MNYMSSPASLVQNYVFQAFTGYPYPTSGEPLSVTEEAKRDELWALYNTALGDVIAFVADPLVDVVPGIQ